MYFAVFCKYIKLEPLFNYTDQVSRVEYLLYHVSQYVWSQDFTFGGKESESNEDHVAFTDTHLPD